MPMNTTFVSRCGVLVRQARRFPPRPHDLRRDLAGRQVVPQAHLPGRAERATHRAPRLRGHADRDAVAVAHEHGLDRVLAAKAQQRLARRASIGRALVEHLDPQGQVGREPLPQRR